MKKVLCFCIFFSIHVMIASTDELLGLIQTPSTQEITTKAQELLRNILPKTTQPDEVICHPFMIFIEQEKERIVSQRIRPQTLFIRIKDIADRYSSSRKQRKNCALFLTICFFQNHPHVVTLLNKRYKEIETRKKPYCEQFLEEKLREIEDFYEKNRKEE